MDRRKKVLISMLVMGALAALGAGTYASFTAEVSNTNNYFQTGTLALGTAPNSTASTCFSYGTLNAQNEFTNGNVSSCSLAVNLLNNKPGGTLQTFVVNLENKGSLPATVSLGGTCASADDPAFGFHGTGNVCGGVTLAIQPCTGAYAGGQTCGGAANEQTACIYPYSTTQRCSALAPATAATFNSTYTINASNVPSGTWANGGTNALVLASWAAGAKQAYEVRLQLPDTGATAGVGNENPYQGKQLNLSLYWYAVQS